MQSLRNQRNKYFRDLQGSVTQTGIDIVYLTHILPDREEILESLSKMGNVKLIIAIPYSVDQTYLCKIESEYSVERPSLDELYSKAYLIKLLQSFLDRKFIIVEIGGYFSIIHDWLTEHFGKSFLGVIESTESGHRRYEELEQHQFPIGSIARSHSKAAEDTKVGASNIFTLESLLRSRGLILSAFNCLVLGYGKVGRMLAYDLRARGCNVSVYDTDNTQRILAHGEGFLIPPLNKCLLSTQIIFGATGGTSLTRKNLEILRNETILVSCSSKNNEFDIKYLDDKWNKKIDEDGTALFTNPITKRNIIVLSNGTPINFQTGGIIGPLLSLTHGELLLTVEEALNQTKPIGIWEINEIKRAMVSEKWINEFICKETGSAKSNFGSLYSGHQATDETKFLTLE